MKSGCELVCIRFFACICPDGLLVLPRNLHFRNETISAVRCGMFFAHLFNQLGLFNTLHDMKRTLLTISMFTLLVAMSSNLQAQAACAPRPISTSPSGSGVAQMATYKTNFSNAVIAGNARYAEMHRQKLVSFMERDVLKSTSTTAVASAAGLPDAADPLKVKSATEDLARQKAIIASLKTMSITDANSLASAKSKLGMLDEFEQIMQKKVPATTH
jgi:hypothetical protein